MRYYLIALFLLVCFALGSSLGQSKDPLPDVNLEIQELSIDLGDFNTSLDPENDSASDIRPGVLGAPVRRS